MWLRFCRRGRRRKDNAFNALREIIPRQKKKTQAVEFNDRGDIDTPGEYFSHPGITPYLTTCSQDVDTLIYVHAAKR